MRVFRVQAEATVQLPSTMDKWEARERVYAMIQLALHEIGETSIVMLEVIPVEQEQ